MTNASKAKGTRWESRLVEYLVGHGFPFAERRSLSGAADKGDISGVIGVVWEAKDHKTFDLSGWMDEAIKERENAGAQLAVVCFPRRNHPTARAYCLIELQDFVGLIK